MTNSSNERLWGLVLAGGDGTRLQALTRLLAGAPIPKQYCRIVGEHERITPWNFSRDFLAHVPEHLLVARADDLGWSDWGTPESIERTLATMGVVPPWRAPLRATA